MDKRYQVFVSSTYSDLKDERKLVTQSLLELDCFPQGMELFPAADEEQWEFIKKIIDDCDYYVLIVGGRYGSTTPEGISYTEKEYDYAIEKGIPVLSFIHESPNALAGDKAESDDGAKARLDAFRVKAKAGKLVKNWSDAKLLPALVVTSLSRTMKTHPAIGWVRADKLPTEQLLAEMNELRKLNKDLLADKTANERKVSVVAKDLAGLNDTMTVSGTYRYAGQASTSWKRASNWGGIFALISPYLLINPPDEVVKDKLKQIYREWQDVTNATHFSINDFDYQTLKIQFMALGLVDIVYAPTVGGGMGLFWNLTKKGKETMVHLRAVKAAK